MSLIQKPKIVDPKYYEDHERCACIRRLIKEALQAHHSDGGKRIHKVGVASKVQGKISRLTKRNQFPFGVISDLYVYRRLEYLAGEDDYVQFVRKGSGWYRLNPVLFEKETR